MTELNNELQEQISLVLNKLTISISGLKEDILDNQSRLEQRVRFLEEKIKELESHECKCSGSKGTTTQSEGHAGKSV
jgi:gas vesicle protein